MSLDRPTPNRIQDTAASSSVGGGSADNWDYRWLIVVIVAAFVLFAIAVVVAVMARRFASNYFNSFPKVWYLKLIVRTNHHKNMSIPYHCLLRNM